MAKGEDRNLDAEKAEDMDLPDFDAFIKAAKAGAQPPQIVAWAEKMAKWAGETRDLAQTLAGHLRELENELTDALADSEANGKHVANLTQMIRDARRRIATGADMIQYLDDHELWGPDETQASINFSGAIPS